MAPPDAVLVVVLAILGVWLVLVAILWFHRPSRDLAIPAIRLVPDLVRLVRALLADATVPRRVKVALGGLLLYLVSPIDLVPEAVPIIGSVDDLIVAALVLRWVGRQLGVERLRSTWRGSPESFDLLRRLLGT